MTGVWKQDVSDLIILECKSNILKHFQEASNNLGTYEEFP